MDEELKKILMSLLEEVRGMREDLNSFIELQTEYEGDEEAEDETGEKAKFPVFSETVWQEGGDHYRRPFVERIGQDPRHGSDRGPWGDRLSGYQLPR